MTVLKIERVPVPRSVCGYPDRCSINTDGVLKVRNIAATPAHFSLEELEAIVAFMKEKELERLLCPD